MRQMVMRETTNLKRGANVPTTFVHTPSKIIFNKINVIKKTATSGFVYVYLRRLQSTIIIRTLA